MIVDCDIIASREDKVQCQIIWMYYATLSLDVIGEESTFVGYDDL